MDMGEGFEGLGVLEKLWVLKNDDVVTTSSQHQHLLSDPKLTSISCLNINLSMLQPYPANVGDGTLLSAPEHGRHIFQRVKQNSQPLRQDKTVCVASRHR
ncbi:hypothetical protein RND71_035262 [Anisodus tanguticus]|uniref:Uncharacterized protein n=1 Tax=Anisodus tanguticus TaxID=243964 RepID=A0AAE1UZM3_9SOLA|nr:hypothetical protein RND71_035262 [Anisodus tanguticus]